MTDVAYRSAEIAGIGSGLSRFGATYPCEIRVKVHASDADRMEVYPLAHLFSDHAKQDILTRYPGRPKHTGISSSWTSDGSEMTFFSDFYERSTRFRFISQMEFLGRAVMKQAVKNGTLKPGQNLTVEVIEPKRSNNPMAKWAHAVRERAIDLAAVRLG
jgi:hypothetical protein